jgi:hypothetical protein
MDTKKHGNIYQCFNSLSEKKTISKFLADDGSILETTCSVHCRFVPGCQHADCSLSLSMCFTVGVSVCGRAKLTEKLCWNNEYPARRKRNGRISTDNVAGFVAALCHKLE